MAASAGIEYFLGVEETESPAERISRVRRGLPYESLEKIQEALQLSLAELADALAISTRTLNRRKEENSLNLEESDRVFSYRPGFCPRDRCV